MRDRYAILDTKKLRLHLCGPGDYELETMLPPGTETFQCEISPSGHMVIPCCEYEAVEEEERGKLDEGKAIALASSQKYGPGIDIPSIQERNLMGREDPTREITVTPHKKTRRGGANRKITPTESASSHDPAAKNE